MQCDACGKISDRVRECCEKPDSEALCDGCYYGNKGSHHNKTHNARIEPRKKIHIGPVSPGTNGNSNGSK